jgi:hypothetical protein
VVAYVSHANIIGFAMTMIELKTNRIVTMGKYHRFVIEFVEN